MRAASTGAEGSSLLELIVAACCTTLLAGAVLPLLVGGAEAERYRERRLSAELRVDSALRSIALDLRAAGVGLEGGDSVAVDGHAEPVVASLPGGGLRILRALAPPIEIASVVDAHNYRIGELTGLQPGIRIVALGLPGRPDGAALPAGTVADVLPSAQGGIVDVSWGAASAEVWAWGPPRALLPVSWRQYEARARAGGLQLRRRDTGGSWQPVVDELSGFDVAFLVDHDADFLPDEMTEVWSSPGGGSSLVSVRLEARSEVTFGGEIAAHAWVRVRGP